MKQKSVILLTALILVSLVCFQVSAMTLYESYFGTNALNGDTSAGQNASYQSFTIGTTGLNQTFEVEQVELVMADADQNQTVYVAIYNATNYTDCLFNELIAYGETNVYLPSGAYYGARFNVTLSKEGILEQGKTYCLMADVVGGYGTIWTLDRSSTYTGGYFHSRDLNQPNGAWCDSPANCYSYFMTPLFGIWGDPPEVPLIGQTVYIDADYSYQSSGIAGQVISDTTGSIATTINWFPIILIISVMIVLILLTVIIITKIRSANMMEGSA